MYIIPSARAHRCPLENTLYFLSSPPDIRTVCKCREQIFRLKFRVVATTKLLCEAF